MRRLFCYQHNFNGKIGPNVIDFPSDSPSKPISIIGSSATENATTRVRTTDRNAAEGGSGVVPLSRRAVICSRPALCDRGCSCESGPRPRACRTEMAPLPEGSLCLYISGRGEREGDMSTPEKAAPQMRPEQVARHRIRPHSPLITG